MRRANYNNILHPLAFAGAPADDTMRRMGDLAVWMLDLSLFRLSARNIGERRNGRTGRT